MRRAFTIATLAILSGACSEQSFPTVSSGNISLPTQVRRVSGTVVPSVSQDSLVLSAPIANAPVTLWAAVAVADSGFTYQQIGTTTTDALGKFTFENASTGALQIEAAAPLGSNYQTSYLGVAAGNDAVSDLVLRLVSGGGTGGGGNPITPDSSIVTNPGADRTIAGKVLGIGTIVGSDSGKVSGPVVGATITASQYKNGVLTTIGSATTDNAGKFSMPQMSGALVILTITPPSVTPYRSGTYFANPTSGTVTTITAYLYPVPAD